MLCRAHGKLCESGATAMHANRKKYVCSSAHMYIRVFESNRWIWNKEKGEEVDMKAFSFCKLHTQGARCVEPLLRTQFQLTQTRICHELESKQGRKNVFVLVSF